MIRFSKMQGAGNDFVVIDCINQSLTMTPALARAIADRHFGIGCDQILLVERTPDPAAAEFGYRIFNADGGEVEHCGNGARCFVRFAREQGLTAASEIRVATQCGIIVPRMEADGSVTVDMGPPGFALERLPFNASGLTADAGLWPIELPGGRRVSVALVSMGNPHAVQRVVDVDTAPVSEDGPAIEGHRRFPARVNAGFMQIVDRHTIALRVYERGAGETLACGTGACAAVVAGIRQGWLDSPVTVRTRGGLLTIAWNGGGADRDAAASAPVLMTGPAVTVFEGAFDPEQLRTSRDA